MTVLPSSNSNLLLLNDGKIYLPDGVTPYKRGKVTGPRIQVLRETHRPDPEIQRQIDRKVGLNWLGEPLYRVVWGWSRLDWCAGLMTRYDEGGRFLREEYGIFYEPKYDYLGRRDGLSRWIVEKWFPAESYGSPETWAYQTREIDGYQECQALGPYPSRGDYELSFVVQHPLNQAFIQLTHSIVDMVVEIAERNREIEAARRRQAKKEELERQELKRRQLYADVWDEAAPAFGGVPNTTQANAPMPNTKSELKKQKLPRATSPRGISIIQEA
ncbi:MAG: hypothetical protein L0338_39675 [Acidobacteria bacterium]|nr:hypothetical protein [Acidobacteriota bacterium]